MNKQIIASALAGFAGLWLSATAVAAVPTLELSVGNVDAVLAQDSLKQGPQPYRFAVAVAVAATPANQGVWSTTADGSALWQLAVHSTAATSLNFGFTRLSLPPGAELRLHAPDGSEARGPYGSEYNAQGQLWTPVIRGSAAVIELKLPAALRDQVKLTLGVVNHGFRGFGAKTGAVAKSGSCNIDVVCSDGDDWRNEIRSVARYTISGVLLCTGSLINNSKQDLAPYFLTANHCVTTAAQAPTTVFYWNYQTSRCGGTPDGKLDQTQTGALFLAGSGGATATGPDFTLLQLLAKPDPAFRVYYAGWDRRDIAPVGVTGIHHPNGDEKRISMDYNQTFITAYGEVPGSAQSSLMPTHIMIASWNRGVTEGGSSGSGLWNREHRLVGQLSGGSSACSTPNGSDWYGRIYGDFSNAGTPLTSLSFWLDPNGNTELLNGIDASSAAPPAAGGSVSLPGGSSNGGSTNSGSAGGGGGAFGGSALLLLAASLRRRLRRH